MRFSDAGRHSSCILRANGASAMIVRETAALARCFSYFHFVGVVGVKWGCKRSDRIYPVEKWPGRPSAVTFVGLPTSGRSPTSSRGFKLSNSLYLAAARSARIRGARASQTRGCVVNVGTKCRRDGQAARYCRPLVYEPGVRFRRVDSILFATIYSTKDLRAYTRED